MSFYEELTKQLKIHEGFRQFPYRCTAGRLTIGIGRNLDAKGVSEEEAEELLQNDIYDVEIQLDKNIPWWRNKPENVQLVLMDMCFNLGMSGLLTFDKFLHAVRLGFWETAQMEMMNSLWATQVGTRADNLREML